MRPSTTTSARRSAPRQGCPPTGSSPSATRLSALAHLLAFVPLGYLLVRARPERIGVLRALLLTAAFADSYNQMVKALRNYKAQEVKGGLGKGGQLKVGQ